MKVLNICEHDMFFQSIFEYIIYVVRYHIIRHKQYVLFLYFIMYWVLLCTSDSDFRVCGTVREVCGTVWEVCGTVREVCGTVREVCGSVWSPITLNYRLFCSFGRASILFSTEQGMSWYIVTCVITFKHIFLTKFHGNRIISCG